jgi:hypothetical protein
MANRKLDTAWWMAAVPLMLTAGFTWHVLRRGVPARFVLLQGLLGAGLLLVDVLVQAKRKGKMEPDVEWSWMATVPRAAWILAGVMGVQWLYHVV